MSNPRKKENYPLVEVRWYDSCSDSGWKHKVDSDLMTCWTAGYLVHRSARSTVVALNCGSQQSTKSHGDTMIIPTRCIQKIRRLR